jgi:hypothetical protein
VEPKTLFVLVLGVTLVNGMISPMLPLLAALAPVWLPDFFEPTPQTVFYGASLMVALGTLVLSGVPAALFERISGLKETTQASMLVWLGAAALLTLPSLA